MMQCEGCGAALKERHAYCSHTCVDRALERRARERLRKLQATDCCGELNAYGSPCGSGGAYCARCAQRQGDT